MRLRNVLGEGEVEVFVADDDVENLASQCSHLIGNTKDIPIGISHCDQSIQLEIVFRWNIESQPASTAQAASLDASSLKIEARAIIAVPPRNSVHLAPKPEFCVHFRDVVTRCRNPPRRHASSAFPLNPGLTSVPV